MTNTELFSPEETIFDESSILYILRDMLTQIPEFKWNGNLEPLSGGLLNYVWRISGKTGSNTETLIVKWAPPFVASSPSVQLDPDRIFIEAKAMNVFAPGNVLETLASDSVRLPQLHVLDKSHHMIIMEDVCHCPDLETWIRTPHSAEEHIFLGKALGNFIGTLHRTSASLPGLAEEFNNSKIQRTRLDVLYGNILNYATKAIIQDANFLSQKALHYGRQLQLPGKVLIMGDLWPRSLIVTDNKLRIFDWELAHFGKPSQDIGHFAAHLWMQAQRKQENSNSDHIIKMLNAFLLAYRISLGNDFDYVFGNEGIDESSIHFGCEILARTVGIFQAGYVYEGLDIKHPSIIEAVNLAASNIRHPERSEIFKVLREPIINS